jgi:hypothetical protein
LALKYREIGRYCQSCGNSLENTEKKRYEKQDKTIRFYKSWEECNMAEKKAPVAAAKAEEKKTSTEAVKTTEEPKKAAVKETVKAAAPAAAKEEKKPAAKKAPAKKAAAAKKPAAKPAARKTAAKKAAVAASVVLQYGGREFDTAELAEKVKQLWTGEMGRKEAELKDIKVYVKPEEFMAYYVINGDITGSFDL